MAAKTFCKFSRLSGVFKYQIIIIFSIVGINLLISQE